MAISKEEWERVADEGRAAFANALLDAIDRIDDPEAEQAMCFGIVGAVTEWLFQRRAPEVTVANVERAIHASVTDILRQLETGVHGETTQ